LFGGLLIAQAVFLAIGPSHLARVLDRDSLFVFGSTFLGAVLAGGGPDGCRRLVAALWRGRARSRDEFRSHLALLRLGAGSAVLIGLLMTLIGTINMLSSGVTDLTLQAYGAAVALLTLLYGLGTALVCLILSTYLRHGTPDGAGGPAPAAET
jgi:hypothetical protein